MLIYRPLLAESFHDPAHHLYRHAAAFVKNAFQHFPSVPAGLQERSRGSAERSPRVNVCLTAERPGGAREVSGRINTMGSLRFLASLQDAEPLAGLSPGAALR